MQFIINEADAMHTTSQQNYGSIMAQPISIAFSVQRKHELI